MFGQPLFLWTFVLSIPLPHVMDTSAAVIFLRLILSGDVELNPGPKEGNQTVTKISALHAYLGTILGNIVQNYSIILFGQCLGQRNLSAFRT